MSLHLDPGGRLPVGGRRPDHPLQVLRRLLLHGRRRTRLLLRPRRRGRRHPRGGTVVRRVCLMIFRYE